MKGMNLSGKPGIVQPMQIPPDVGAPTDPTHPASLADVAIHDRSPTSQLHDASRGTVFIGELSLLVIASAIASFVNRRSEKPCGTQLFVERNLGAVRPRATKRRAASP